MDTFVRLTKFPGVISIREDPRLGPGREPASSSSGMRYAFLRREENTRLGQPEVGGGIASSWGGGGGTERFPNLVGAVGALE